MSRGGDREAFVKGQLDAVHKALTKYEMPLKPKHARSLILGTHQEKSCNIFWNVVNRIQLEKHPVLTWKFAHLLHKLIRDGHRKVPEESHRFIPRIKQFGQFWKHLNTSGYGICNETYANLLVDRLEFHRKYPVVPGNLTLSDSQLKTLQDDLDNAFEMTISMLDEMDNLLNLQTKVYDTMECLRWSSLVPQGQCLLAPLILVILDTSKFYDYLVKMIFKLHSQVPPDALEGHRARFRTIFNKTKRFYDESRNLQYFKFLVSIPSLPVSAPNFLQASDLESYQTPHAYLRSEGSDDGQSNHDETLLDIGVEAAPAPSSIPEIDPRDDQILSLQRSVEDERFAKERLLAEARNRIEQYENKLAQMQAEYEHARREADDMREEKERITNELASRDSMRAESDDARVLEAINKTKLSDERFEKMKKIYEQFRREHVDALTKLGNLQKQIEESEKKYMDKEAELTVLGRRLEESEKDKLAISVKAEGEASTVDDLRTELARAEVDMEALREELAHLRTSHQNELVQASEKLSADQLASQAKWRGAVNKSLLEMLDHCEEDLPNATSISYPPHLAQSALINVSSMWNETSENAENNVFAIHRLTSALLACSSAAYTASIQHYDPIADLCKNIVELSKKSVKDNSVHSSVIPKELEKLNLLMTALPVNSDVDKDAVGNELETEMRRMDEVIKQAVEQIEAIQRKSRENAKGVRLEVNEAILATCQALMSAIMRLVASSRELQMEIVAAGRAGISPVEFYKRNHQWTEGLLSAAKSVGVAATVLVAAADGVITGQGKFEQLIVAAQEIAASTAQLFVSSRVKADRDSEKLSALSTASREVNQCTAQVVASVKSGQTTLNEQDVLDFSHLTLHEAKKEEMESQVRMLELEQALNMEKARLRELRKRHYHMAQVANKDAADTSFEFLG